MDIIARLERMIDNEQSPRKREEMRKVLKDTLKQMEVSL